METSLTSSNNPVYFPHKEVDKFASVVFKIADLYGKWQREAAKIRAAESISRINAPSLQEIQFQKVAIQTLAIYEWMNRYVELKQDYVSFAEFNFIYESLQEQSHRMEALAASIQYRSVEDNKSREWLSELEEQIQDQYDFIVGGLTYPTMRNHLEKENESV